MKTKLCGLTLFFALLLLSAGLAAAQTDRNVVSLGNVTVAAGSSGTFTLDLANQDSVAGGEFSFSFDTTNGLTITTIQATSRLSGFTLTTDQTANGSVVTMHGIFFNLNSLTVAPGNGAIVTLSYSLSPTATGQTALYLTQALLADSNSNALTTNMVDGAVSASFACSNVSEIPQSECNALVALYNSTGGTNWITSTGWLKNNQPCGWFGVTCSNGQVAIISLTNNNLVGIIPTQIGNLPKLIGLNLSGNKLTGSIPKEIGNLTSLEYLYLVNNQLTGSLPVEMGNMTKLREFTAFINEIDGTIPPQLGNLTNLEVLCISINKFTGSIPSELGNLTKLKSLCLGNTYLTGTLPENLKNLTNLEGIDLVNLKLGDTLPNWIGDSWPNLTGIGLEGGGWKGALPSNFTKLNKLTRFHYYNSQLCTPNTPAFQTWLQGIADTNPTYANTPWCQASTFSGSISINNGAATTNSRDVTLALNATSTAGQVITMSLTDDFGTWEQNELSSQWHLNTVVENDATAFDGKAFVSNGSGYMVFGPYTYDLPLNKPLFADFRLKVANNTLTETVIHLDIVDYNLVTGFRILAQLSLKGTDFEQANQYQIFRLNFMYPSKNDSGVEFRVQTYGKTDVTFDNVMVYTPETYVISHNWILKDQQGERWVGVKFQDNLGNWSDLYTDSIKLDCSGLCNPNFTKGQEFWTWANQITEKQFLDTLDVGHDGTNYAYKSVQYFDTQKSSLWRGPVQDVFVTPNQLYTFEAWLKYENACSVDVRVDWLNKDGQYLTSSRVMPLTDGNSDGWVKKSNIVTTAVEAFIGRVVFFHGVNSQTQQNCSGSTLWVDDVTFEPVQTFTCSNVSEIPTSECQALTALYTSTNGVNWGTKTNWLVTNQPCGWYGIQCVNGNVVSIGLVNNNLNGILPTKIGDFKEIISLYLNDNQLQGNIPIELGSLPKLINLELHRNQLTGSIPLQLSNLSNLQRLLLYSNKLTGDIPRELGNLHALQGLGLQDNQLTGMIPLSFCYNMPALIYLGLNNNQLYGNVPACLGNLAQVTDLHFANNPLLVGSLPSTFTAMKLNWFTFNNTGLCEPTSLQTWLNGITNVQRTGINCEPTQIFADSGQNLGNLHSTDVGMGDFDGDGDTDAFVTGLYTSAKVWLNNGQGFFTDSGQNPTIGNSHGLALGDLDKDGDLDAFVIGWNKPPYIPSTIWLNDGHGHFTDSGQRIGNSPTYDVTLGDVDNDGDLDAAIGNDDQPSELWLNDGTGKFTDSRQRFSNAYTMEMVFGDIDKDGDLDIFRANGFWVDLWRNDGTGRFTQDSQKFTEDNSTTNYMPANSVALGDLDKDGDLDAVFSKTSWNTNGAGYYIWFNNGAGIFTKSNQLLGNNISYYTTLGDFDGDNDLDIYGVSHFSQEEDSLWLNNGTGVFTDSLQRFPHNHGVVARTADLDGDKDLDMFVVRYYGEPDKVLFNKPTQSPTPTLALSKTADKTSVQAGDTVTYAVVISATGLTQTVYLTNTMPFGLTPINLPSGLSYDTTTRQLRYNGLVNGTLTLTYQVKVATGLAKGSILYSGVEATSGDLWAEAGLAVVIPQPDLRKVMVVPILMADNNLGQDGLDQLNATEKALCNLSQVVALVWLDGPTDHDSRLYLVQCDTNLLSPNYNDYLASGRYVLGQNLWDMNENSTSEHAFAELLTAVTRAYPNLRNVAELYVMIAGHGGAPMPSVLLSQPASRGSQPASRGSQPDGLGYDEHPSLRTMDVNTLGRVVAQFEAATGKKIGLLYLNACLMSNLEVYTEIAPHVNTVIGSAGIKFATFDNMTNLLTALEGQPTTAEVVQKWVASESDLLKPDGYPMTFWGGELSHTNVLVEAMNHFAELALIRVKTATGHEQIRQARLHTACVDNNLDGKIDENDSVCDIGSFMAQIEQQFSYDEEMVAAAQAVRQVLAVMTLKEVHQSGIPYGYNTQTWHYADPFSGVTIFLPLATDTWQRPLYNERYFAFAKQTQWDEFLNAYWQNAIVPDYTCPTTGCGLPNGNIPLAPLDMTLTYGTSNTVVINWTSQPNTAYTLWRWVSGQTPAPYKSNLTGSSLTDSLPRDNNEYCYQLATTTGDWSVVRCLTSGQSALVIANTYGKPGSRITVNIDMRNAQNLCLAAANIAVIYPTHLLKPLQVKPAALTQGYAFTMTTQVAGQVRLATFKANCSPLYGSGTIARIEFEVLGSEGQSGLLTFATGLTHTVLYAGDDLRNPLDVMLQSGKFTISGACIMGDVNCDGGVNAADALMALQIATNLIIPTPDEKTACDTNGDGKCSSADATLTLCYAAKQDWNQCGGILSRFRQVSTQAVKVCVGAARGQVNQTVTVPLKITQGSGVAGGDLVLTYNAANLTVQEVSPTTLTSTALMKANLQEAGVIRLAFANQIALTEDGNLFNLQVKLKQPKANITINEAAFHDVNGRDFSTNLQRQIETSVCASMNEIYLPLIIR